MGRKTIVIAPTLPATAKLSRFHGDATDTPLYTIVTWMTRHARSSDAKNDAAVVRKRQLALETASHRLLELQRVGASSDKNRSWFVGNLVHQDGSLVMLTPMDPLFVLLHAVVDQKERYLSTYDLLARDHNTWWLQLGPTLTQSTVERICDVQFTGDDAIDNLYVRANDTKILTWLATKVTRIATVLAETAAINASNGAFNAKFVLPGQTPLKQDNKKEVEAEPIPDQLKRFYGEAIEVLADYLPISIVPALHKHFNISTTKATVPSSGASDSDPLDSIRRFDRRAEPEPVTTSTPSKRPSANGAAAANSATKKKSKLANVDRTGMKSISSFFGKK